MILQKQPCFPPIIGTERLILRPITHEDAHAIFEYASDEEVTRYLTWDTHASIRDTRAYINHTQNAYKTGEHFDYAITLRESGRMIGAGGCSKTLPEGAHFAEIGYVLNRDYWGFEYAPEAMKGILRFLFEVKQVHRVEAYHVIQNETSGRVMQKLGMTCEGLMRDKYFFKGRFWSVKQYAILNPGDRSF